MKRNRKLPVQVAFAFFKSLGVSHLSEFEKLKIRSSQKDGTAIVMMQHTEKLNTEFWADICDFVADLSNLWDDELKVKLKIKKDMTSAELLIKSR